jgi:hypothetical protein
MCPPPLVVARLAPEEAPRIPALDEAEAGPMYPPAFRLGIMAGCEGGANTWAFWRALERAAVADLELAEDPPAPP